MQLKTANYLNKTIPQHSFFFTLTVIINYIILIQILISFDKM